MFTVFNWIVFRVYRFSGVTVIFPHIFVIVQMYMQRLWRIFFAGYNLYLFSCCYCCTSYTFLSYNGKVFSVFVHVLHCILFSIHLYNKNAWFAILLSICLVPASYKNILFVILAIKNCREHISFFNGCFAFWECCHLKHWVMLILKFFLMGAHVKFYKGLFFFFTWLCLFCCW